MKIPYFPNDIRSRFQGYSGARPDVLRLIRARPTRVLDVGCGAGITASLIGEKFPGVTTVGVEPDAALRTMAQKHMSEVIPGKIDDSVTLENLRRRDPFDLVLCADVLEHIADPQDTLAQLTTLLAPRGYLITSIPNVRHVSTFISLGLLGTWPARARGIHDRTHLRFFARRNIIALGQGAGLRMVSERRNLRLIESKPWSAIPAKLVDFWPLRGFFTFQYLHLWERAIDGSA